MSAAVSLPEPFRCTAEEVLARLDTDAQRGLSTAEAARRLERHGRNELPAEKPTPAWRLFLAQFQDALVILLLVAAAVSGVLWLLERETALPYEALAILAVVLFNAGMGYLQRARAERAVAALRRLSAPHATVLRDGSRIRIAAAELVPGDIILLEQGDTVPADARLIRVAGLQASEAMLTGESLPVTKDVAPIAEDVPLGDRTNMVFGGTSITYGRGLAVVTATGVHTHMGGIAGLLERAPEQTTPLQAELGRTGRVLGLVVTALAIVMIAATLLVADVRGIHALFEVIILGVALAVAAVPEGLPAVITTVLSIGVQRMARRNAIVRVLAAVETLGSATVIASDKTGTLTRNEMTVRRVVTASGSVLFTGTGYAPHGTIERDGGGAVEGDLREELVRALSAAERASNAVLRESGGRWSVQGDPTEGALIVAARKAGLEKEVLDARFERIGEVPFSSERKIMSTLHRDAGRGERLLAFTKGAPDVLLARCSLEQVGAGSRPLTPERRAEIAATNDALAGEALRTLGVAYRAVPAEEVADGKVDDELEHDLVFLGLIGMIDPPRAEARDAVARAKGAGVRPIMITGDHPKTAAVIAAELGITADGGVVSGRELERMPAGELAQAVKDVSVYARVSPEHKLRIVRALQDQGATVAMTGDGVNDAPALKMADIGIAMGASGTDVARQAADMVLADDNFATIVAAVEEGRGIFANIRKFLRYMLSTNMGEVITVFIGVLFADAIGLGGSAGGPMLPLLATQILWINLVTDGAPALALGIDPPDPGLMNRPPRPRGEPVITARMWRSILSIGAVMAAGTLLVIDACLPGGLIEGAYTPQHARTMAFTTLVLFSLFTVLATRDEERSAFAGLFSNKWLLLAIASSLLLQAAVVYAPFLQRAFSTVALDGADWWWCAAVASSVLWLSELRKAISRAAGRAGKG